MKRIELLAPAGNMEALVGAIEAGADAVYIGGKNFGARAFSKNFSDSEIIEAINYAHLYGVKVYVTVNTLIYDDEVDEFLKYIEFIHKNNVDAVLIQDLGMFDLVRQTFPNLEIHASTQMHIHNLDGVKLMHRLGIKRVVLARETSIDLIKEIRKNTDCEIEVFVHGALCISYSGECLMSSLIGGRSGNRGVCAGACRLKYDVVDNAGKKLNKGDYPLSTKDLNSLEYIGELIDAGVDSLKIEGRMKSTEYVYKVVSMYRLAIDSYYKNGKVLINPDDLLELKKIFNREYTKGFLNNAPNDDIINGKRPNHMGVKIGEVVNYKDGFATIKLTDDLMIGSGLRVLGGHEDVGINVNEFYINRKLVKEAHKGDTISIKTIAPVRNGDSVLITLDSKLNSKINKLIEERSRKVLIKGKFSGHTGNKCVLTFDDGVNLVKVCGNVVSKAMNKPTSKEDICSKLNKLGGSVYKYSGLDIDIDDDIFIPISEINNLRQEAIELLNKHRLYKSNFTMGEYKKEVPDFKEERLLTCLIDNEHDMNSKYDLVYADRKIPGTILKLPRVITEYPDIKDMVMIGEIGGANKYKSFITDFSLNVTNSYTVAFLHSLGAKRVTLSYELNDLQIENLVKSYLERYKKHPNLELIVSAYPEVMISKYSINKQYNRDNLFLKDTFGNRFKIKDKDGCMYIYHYKKRDIYDDKYYDMGINSLRINLDI